MGIPRRVQELWGAYNNIEPNNFNRRFIDTKSGRFDASRFNTLSTLDSSYNVDAFDSLGNTIRARVLGVVSVIPSRLRFPDLYERTATVLNDGSGAGVQEHYVFSLRSEFDFHIRNPDNMGSTEASVNAALMNGVAISNVPSVQFGPVGAGDIVEVYLPNKNSYTGARVVGVTIRNNVNALSEFAQIQGRASGVFTSLANAVGGAFGGLFGGLGGAGGGLAGTFDPNVGIGNYELDPNDPTRSLYLTSLWVEEEREYGWRGTSSDEGRKRYNNPYGSDLAIFKPNGQSSFEIPSINDRPESVEQVLAAFPGLREKSESIHPGRLLRNFIKWCTTDDDQGGGRGRRDLPWRDGTKDTDEIYDEVMNQIWANDKQRYLTSNDPGSRAVGWFREWRRAPVKERRWPPGSRSTINTGVELSRIFHGHRGEATVDPFYNGGYLPDDFGNQYCAYICWDAWAQALGEMGLRQIIGHPDVRVLNADRSDWIDGEARDLYKGDRRRTRYRKYQTNGGISKGFAWALINDFSLARRLHLQDAAAEAVGERIDPSRFGPDAYFPIMDLPYERWGQHRWMTTRLQFNQILKSGLGTGSPIEKYLVSVEPDEELRTSVGLSDSLPGGLRPGDIMGRCRNSVPYNELSEFNKENMKYIGFDPETIDMFPIFFTSDRDPGQGRRSDCLLGGETTDWIRELGLFSTSRGHAEMVVYVWGDGIVWQVGGNTGAGGSAVGGNLFESMFRVDNPNFNTKDNTCLKIGGTESPYGPIINPFTGEDLGIITIEMTRKGRVLGYCRPQWGCPAEGPTQGAPWPALIPGAVPPPVDGPVIPPVVPGEGSDEPPSPDVPGEGSDETPSPDVPGGGSDETPSPDVPGGGSDEPLP